MKKALFFIFLFLSSHVNARMDMRYDNRTSACGNLTGTANQPYKIHTLHESVSSSGGFPFYLTAQLPNVVPTLHLVTGLHYNNNNKRFTNRHGEVLTAVDEQIGLYIRFADGTEVEVTTSTIDVQLNNMGENVYGGLIFYRLKKELREFGNGNVEVDSRFTITCTAP